MTQTEIKAKSVQKNAEKCHTQKPMVGNGNEKQFFTFVATMQT